MFRKKIRDELKVVERAKLDDLDCDNLVSFLSSLGVKKPRVKALDEDKVLRLSGILEDDKPTICGMMLLGEYPQGFFPQLSITAMAVKGNEIGEMDQRGVRFIDDKRIEGTIPQMLDDAVSFVIKNMKNAVAFNARGKREDIPEYPVVAVREAILNALIHRDYSRYTEDSPIRIIMYDDRLVVENPGGIYGRLSVDDLGKIPGDTRNPFIAGGLEVMIGAENRFSGIPTIRKEMKDAGLPAPVFESSRGMFRVTLYNREKALAVNSDLTIQEKIVNYCSEPRTKEEIADMLNIRTAYYVVSKYLRPMVAEGVLKLMLPDRPKSKFQKYYVEE